MFKKSSHKRRSSSFPVTIFRFLLSLIIFAILLGGLYSAYRHFSGLDPVKVSPQSVVSNYFSKEKLLGFILGFLATDQKGSKDSSKTLPKDIEIPQTVSTKPVSHSQPDFKFLIVTDSHNENNLLQKAINQASRNSDIKFVVGLGDYTEVGTVKELEDAKAVFDEAGIRYFVTPGDHDLWDSRDKQHPALTNFTSVFGKSYQAFSLGSSRFIILDDSDNYEGIGQEQINWLRSELEKDKNAQDIQNIYVLSHEPFYHPSSDRVIGKTVPKLKDEAKMVLALIRSAGVGYMIFGDIHFFTEYDEPETGIHMTTIGAVASQRNPQNPRYGVVTVYQDGSLGVEDIEIK